MSDMKSIERKIAAAQYELEHAQKELKELREIEDCQPKDWNDVPMDTLIEVQSLHNKEWKPRYFCCYLPSAGNKKFIAFANGRNQQTACAVMEWPKARLIKD